MWATTIDVDEEDDDSPLAEHQNMTIGFAPRIPKIHGNPKKGFGVFMS